MKTIAISKVFFITVFRSYLFFGIVLGAFLLFTGLFLIQFFVTGALSHTTQASGFWGMGFLGLIVSICLGMNSIQREIKTKTFFMVFCRPVERWVFILGKYLGTMGMVAIIYPLVLAMWFALMAFNGVAVTANHWIALGFIFLEWCVLCSFSLVFASFCSGIFHE